jgi:hypothetical protein
MRSDRLERVGMREALLAALDANEATGDPPARAGAHRLR